MYNHPALPLQKAITNALRSNTELMKLITNVYESVPQKAPFPYIAYGSEAYTRGMWEHECFIDLIVATEDKGRVNIKQIENIIIGILDYEDLEVKDFQVEEQGLESIEFGIETTGNSRISIMTFRFLLGAEEANVF